jgi:heme exporter protein B
VKYLSVSIKDLKSEFRLRASLSALLLFIFTAVILVYFASTGKELPKTALSAIYWLILFFGSVTGLAKAFVLEDERNTTLFLKISTTAHKVYYGKLVYNLLLANVINFLSLGICILVLPGFEFSSIWPMMLNVFAGGSAIAIVLTLLSAIITFASAKNALLPVLAFPMILPIIMPAVENTIFAFNTSEISLITNNLKLIFAYSGIILTLSHFLFEFLWQD